MPDDTTPDAPPLGRATAGQLRRAGFVVSPEATPDDATTGFETLTHHVDQASAAEHQAARARGDAFPPGTTPPESAPTGPESETVRHLGAR